MFHILLKVFWKCAPIVHVYSEFHNMIVIRSICADLRNEFDQASGVPTAQASPTLRIILMISLSERTAYRLFVFPWLQVPDDKECKHPSKGN